MSRFWYRFSSLPLLKDPLLFETEEKVSFFVIAILGSTKSSLILRERFEWSLNISVQLLTIENLLSNWTERFRVQFATGCRSSSLPLLWAISCVCVFLQLHKGSGSFTFRHLIVGLSSSFWRLWRQIYDGHKLDNTVVALHQHFVKLP